MAESLHDPKVTVSGDLVGELHAARLEQDKLMARRSVFRPLANALSFGLLADMIAPHGVEKGAPNNTGYPHDVVSKHSGQTIDLTLVEPRTKSFLGLGGLALRVGQHISGLHAAVNAVTMGGWKKRQAEKHQLETAVERFEWNTNPLKKEVILSKLHETRVKNIGLQAENSVNGVFSRIALVNLLAGVALLANIIRRKGVEPSPAEIGRVVQVAGAVSAAVGLHSVVNAVAGGRWQKKQLEALDRQEKQERATIGSDTASHAEPDAAPRPGAWAHKEQEREAAAAHEQPVIAH